MLSADNDKYKLIMGQKVILPRGSIIICNYFETHYKSIIDSYNSIMAGSRNNNFAILNDQIIALKYLG